MGRPFTKLAFFLLFLGNILHVHWVLLFLYRVGADGDTLASWSFLFVTAWKDKPWIVGHMSEKEVVEKDIVLNQTP